MNILAFDSDKYIEQIQFFTDKNIGNGYFSKSELQEILNITTSKHSHNFASFLLINDNDEVKGIRLTYPPGAWHKLAKFKDKLSVEKWSCATNKAAYFQSLFVDPEIQNQGWGIKLSLQSIKILKELGAEAVVCHAWKESPQNSSQRYLEKLGFQKVHEHKNFWKNIDYTCPICSKPCLCTAVEMIKQL